MGCKEIDRPAVRQPVFFLRDWRKNTRLRPKTERRSNSWKQVASSVGIAEGQSIKPGRAGTVTEY